MATQGVIADADGIAALVYSAGDRPDLVLCAFADHLAAAGKRLCGLVQFRDGVRDGSPGRVMVLDSWQIVEVGGKRDAAANSPCRLDARWLDQMGTQAKASIIRRRHRHRQPVWASRGGRPGRAIPPPPNSDTTDHCGSEFEFERWTQFSAA
jgi:hypothetical protein